MHLAEMFRQMVGSAAPQVAGELLGGGRFALSEYQGERPVCLTQSSLNGLYGQCQD